MPKNKNAVFRYRLIDYCLTNRTKVWTFNNLKEYIGKRLQEEYDVEGGISERQLRDDFRIMRKETPVGYAAPIKCRGGKVFYEDSDYSIFQKPLIDPDIKAIEAAYNVAVEDVKTMIMPSKAKVRNTKKGVQKGRKSSYKKAIIKLAFGEEIDLYGEI